MGRRWCAQSGTTALSVDHPAATAFVTGYRQLDWVDLLPAVIGFSTINAISHEIVGNMWYAIRQRLD